MTVAFYILLSPLAYLRSLFAHRQFGTTIGILKVDNDEYKHLLIGQTLAATQKLCLLIRAKSVQQGIANLM